MKQAFEKNGFFYALAGVSISLTILASCAVAENRTAQPTTLEAYQADSLSGHYLAGRFAQRQQDWTRAEQYMREASRIDPNNTLLKQRAFLLAIGAGATDQAKTLAKDIHQENPKHEMSTIFLACDAIKKNDLQKAKDYIASLPEDGFGLYTKPLLTAWILSAEGKHAEAAQLIQSHAEMNDPSFAIHRALILERAGKIKEAEDILSQSLSNGLTLHNASSAADFFSRHGQIDRAAEIYSGTEMLKSLRPVIITNKNITAQTGAAIVLMDIASLLHERRSLDSARIYGQLSLMMAPDYAPALLMMGDVSTVNEQFAQAQNYYAQIDISSPYKPMARLRMAESLTMAGHLDAAIRILEKESQIPNNRVAAFSMLGDIYRDKKEFDHALKAYNAALSDGGDSESADWRLLYARALVLEGMNDWNSAEKDLIHALKFQPDNPMILNYIGYSWVEKGIKLDQAEKFLSRAVELSPTDGYILDSYGWLLYRLGRYEESAQWLEKAVSLVPDDSSILSHVGDAFWQTGRHDEARFKWKRALDISHDQTAQQALRNKITNGLDDEKSFLAQGRE